MKEIYADFNDIAEDDMLPLTCRGSVASIAKLKEPLQDGETVWLTDGELRILATVHLQPNGTWRAESDWDFGTDV